MEAEVCLFSAPVVPPSFTVASTKVNFRCKFDFAIAASKLYAAIGARNQCIHSIDLTGFSKTILI